MTLCARAALGEKTAPPPLSFQASGCPAVVGYTPPVTERPMSWLNPALEVHRSALPLITAHELAGGVNVTDRLVASTSTHVDPLLPVSVYCCVAQLATQFGDVVLEHGGALKSKAEMVVPCGAKIQPPSSARLPKWFEPPLIVMFTRIVPAAGSKPYRRVPAWLRAQIKPIAAMGGPGVTACVQAAVVLNVCAVVSTLSATRPSRSHGM